MAELRLLTGDWISALGGIERRYNCPLCLKKGKTQDTSYKLYVHSCGGSCSRCSKAGRNLTGTYYCQRCTSSGYIGKKKREPLKASKWKEKIARFKREGLRQKEEPCIEIPPVMYLSPRMAAYNYIVSRGISPEDIEAYDIRVGVDKLTGRVVIPNITKEGNWMYWTARDYTESPYRMRYINPPGSQCHRSTQVFNLDRVDSDEIYIVEGVFDSIKIGKDSVATYGCAITEQQINKIASSGVSSVYCALDPEAAKENWELARDLHYKGLEVYLVDLPYGADPGILGRERFKYFADKAKPWTRSEHWRNKVGIIC